MEGREGWRRECYILEKCDQQQFEVEKASFSSKCLNILQLVKINDSYIACVAGVQNGTGEREKRTWEREFGPKSPFPFL